MVWLGLFVGLIVLTIIGLMPGSIEDRGFLVVLVLSAFALLVVVEFVRVIRDRVWQARRSERRYAGWNSSQERRQDLRVRKRAASFGRRSSRVLDFGSGVRSPTPRVSPSSIRRQRELRVKQGRRDAGESRVRARILRGVTSGSDDLPSDDRRRNLDVARSRAGSSRRPRVSPESARRQEELRIRQGMQYALEDDRYDRNSVETLGERRKRERLRKRQERFWQEVRWGRG